MEIRFFVMGPVETFEQRRAALLEVERWVNEFYTLLEAEEE